MTLPRPDESSILAFASDFKRILATVVFQVYTVLAPYMLSIDDQQIIKIIAAQETITVNSVHQSCCQ